MKIRDPYVEELPSVVISGWREGALKVSATKLLNQQTQLGLARSKQCIDDALDGIPTTIQTADIDSAMRLRSSLDDLGWIAVIKETEPVGDGDAEEAV